MVSIQVEVPENAGLLTADGELFHPDPKAKAEIRFKTVAARELAPGARDAAGEEQMIQIEHIVSAAKGRRFVFTSFVSQYFFWDQMFRAKMVGCSTDYIEYGTALDGYPHVRKTLVENVRFYRDGRQLRALRCFFPPILKDPEHPIERIFPIYEKHVSAQLNLTFVEWKIDMTPSFVVEFHHFNHWTDVHGDEYGGNEKDRFFYRMRPGEVLWRQFEKPVVLQYGNPGSEHYDGVSFEFVSPLAPIMFRELKQCE